MNDYEFLSSLIGGTVIFGSTLGLVTLALGVLQIVSIWIIYTKAGKKGWKSLIPIYNIVVLLQIVELPEWYIILYFIPLANIYIMFKTYIELAHKFGKSTGFGVLSVLFAPICLPILAFGKNNLYNGTQNELVTNNVEQQPINPVTFQNQDYSINDNVSNVQINPMTQPEMSPTPMFTPQPLETNQNQETIAPINTVSAPAVGVTTTNIANSVSEETPTPIIAPTMPTVETKIEETPVVSEPVTQPFVMPQNNEVAQVQNTIIETPQVVPEPINPVPTTVEPQIIPNPVNVEPTNVTPLVNEVPVIEPVVQPEMPNNNQENNQNM